MAELPIMPFFTDAYLADTTHLTAEEHGAYLLILLAMWRLGGSLPDDQETLRKIAKITPKAWPRVWESIVGFLEPAEGETSPRVTQNRLLREYRRAQSRSRCLSEYGRKGGKAKALKDKAADVAKATAKRKPGHSLGHSQSHSPATISDKPGHANHNHNHNQDKDSSPSLKAAASAPAVEIVEDRPLIEQTAPVPPKVAAAAIVLEEDRTEDDEDLPSPARHGKEPTFDEIEAMCVSALPRGCSWPVVADPDISPIVTAMRNGADLDLDIVMTIKAISKRQEQQGKSVSNWKFFARAIEEHARDRKAGKLNGKTEETIDPHTAPDAAERQDAMCKTFVATEFWHAAWGPKPGERGCKIPNEILKRHKLINA